MANTSYTESSIDISREPLGAVYAKALLGSVSDVAEGAAILDQLDSLVFDVLAKLPKFESVMASPRISPEEKIRILEIAFAGKMSPLLLTFLKVVAQRGRLDCLRAIRRAARHLANELLGRVEVVVTTAQPIAPSLSDQITNVLGASLKQEVDLKLRTDEEVVGGLMVRVGDTVYDGTVRNQLNRLREETFSQAAQEIQRAIERFAETGS